MKVIDVKHVEDCFDGSLIYELLLDADISKEAIFAIGYGGHIQYFDKFARPFFKIRMKGKYDLKGIEGNRTMRVHLKAGDAFTLEDFLAQIELLTATVQRASPTDGGQATVFGIISASPCVLPTCVAPQG